MTICSSKCLTTDRFPAPVPPPQRQQPRHLPEQSQGVRLDELDCDLPVPLPKPLPKHGKASHELAFCTTITLLPHCTHSTCHTVDPSWVEEKGWDEWKYKSVTSREQRNQPLMPQSQHMPLHLRVKDSQADCTNTFWKIAALVSCFKLLRLYWFLEYSSTNLGSGADVYNVNQFQIHQYVSGAYIIHL